jgi:hypothetical protein
VGPVLILTEENSADDKVHEAMKAKLLAAAMKPVSAVKVVDRSAQGFEAYEKAFGGMFGDAIDARGVFTSLLCFCLLLPDLTWKACASSESRPSDSEGSAR